MTEAVPYDKRDDDTGQFTPEFTDQDFLDAVASVDTPTTSAIQDEVGCEYRTAYARLSDLEEAGELRSEKVGSTLVWRLADS